VSSGDIERSPADASGETETDTTPGIEPEASRGYGISEDLAATLLGLFLLALVLLGIIPKGIVP
jgi:hypothetical protein